RAIADTTTKAERRERKRMEPPSEAGMEQRHCSRKAAVVGENKSLCFSPRDSAEKPGRARPGSNSFYRRFESIQLCTCCSDARLLVGRCAQRQPVGADPLPLLNQESIRFEEGADLRALPAGNVLQHRDEHRDGIAAEHGALRDLGYMTRLGNSDGEPIAEVDVQHDVNVGAAVADVHDVVGADLQLLLQVIEGRDFAVSSGGADNALDFARCVVEELSAVDVVSGHYAFQGGADHFHRRSRQNVEIEIVALDTAGQDLREQPDIFLQANALADFVKVLPAHTRAELGVVQQQIREFGALLHQVQPGHALGLALKLLGRNAQHFAKDVARVVEAKRLVEIAGEELAFDTFLLHGRLDSG